jgi:hypothetical protein
MPRRGNDFDRAIAKDIEVTIQSLDLGLREAFVERWRVTVQVIVAAEHRFVLLALDEPGGALEQLGIADVVEMGVRQQNRPDIRRRDADIGELATDGSDDDPRILWAMIRPPDSWAT